MMKVPIGLLLILSLFNLITCDKREHTETKLLANLFGSGYDFRARPPSNASEPVRVDFRINIKQIYEVSETAQVVSILSTTYQEWRDPRLQWNASDYEGLESFSIYYGFLWTPDTTLYNTVDMYRQNVEDRGNAVIRWDEGNGTGAMIQLIFNTRLTIGCRFEMAYFPFDEQNCTFTFGSWTYDQTQLEYHPTVEFVTQEGYRESTEWTFVSFELVDRSEKYVCCAHPYQTLYAHLVIRRKCLYYVFNLVLPTVIINIMASFGLFASAGNAENRHDKLQIGITTLLSYCILLLTVSDQIPRGSSSIPLISWFFFSVMLQNAIKMYVAIFLSYPDRRRYVKSIWKCVRDKIRACLPIPQKTKVHVIPDAKNQDDPEDRWPEIVCLWISVSVLAAITIIMFSVAGVRIS